MDWKTWCRLCGNDTSLIQIDNDLNEVVFQVFQLKMSETAICSECKKFLSNVNAFKQRATAIQEMFNELSQLTEGTQSPFTIRAHYFGLPECVDFLKDHSREVIIELVSDQLEIEQETCDLSKDDEEFCDGSDSELNVDETQEVRNSKTKRNLEKTESEKLYEFKCHICGVEFPKMQLLSSHCRKVHETSARVSCWCGTYLSSWKRLMAHKSRHIKEEDDFSCKDCKISYKTKSAYERHNLLKHGPEAVKFMCAICGKEFKERQILKNHEKIHLPDELKLKYPCSYCEKKFVNRHCLKIHNARIHEKIALHTCELCGKGCITKSDLKWHMDKHIEERKFECEICHLMFKSTNSLRIHKRRHFNQEKAIVCQVCGKEFFSSAALSNHKLVHSDVKRYKCFCGNEYKRLESYKCHINSTHTGERPFSCMWCNRTFVNSANCRKHKLKEHPLDVAEYEAIHGKKGVSLAMKKS